MKKLSVLLIIVVILLSFLHMPVYFLYNNGYYEENTVKTDIEKNLEYLFSEEDLEIEHDFYKDDIITLLSEMKNIEYTLISRKKAYKILSENNVDKGAKYTSVPTEYNETAEVVLISVQLFEIEDQNYLLCKYGRKTMEAYSLFTFDCTQELSELLDTDIVFSNGRLNMNIRIGKEHAIKSTIKNFIPIIVLMLILLIPYLFNKSQNKTYKTMSKIGYIVIPILIVFVYLKNFLI